jgi:hypothetical protein
VLNRTTSAPHAKSSRRCGSVSPSNSASSFCSRLGSVVATCQLWCAGSGSASSSSTNASLSKPNAASAVSRTARSCARADTALTSSNERSRKRATCCAPLLRAWRGGRLLIAVDVVDARFLPPASLLRLGLAALLVLGALLCAPPSSMSSSSSRRRCCGIVDIVVDANLAARLRVGHLHHCVVVVVVVVVVGDAPSAMPRDAAIVVVSHCRAPASSSFDHSVAAQHGEERADVDVGVGQPLGRRLGGGRCVVRIGGECGARRLVPAAPRRRRARRDPTRSRAARRASTPPCARCRGG